MFADEVTVRYKKQDYILSVGDYYTKHKFDKSNSSYDYHYTILLLLEIESRIWVVYTQNTINIETGDITVGAPYVCTPEKYLKNFWNDYNYYKDTARYKTGEYKGKNFNVI